MGVKHLPDGEDFGSEHFPKDFGFSGSAGGAKATRHAAKPAAAHNPVSTDEHGPGGTPDAKSKFAQGGAAHPHGHEVIDAQHQPDGSVVMHHAHGGTTVHHADGHMSHHDADGTVVHGHTGVPGAGGQMQDASTHVGKQQRQALPHGEPDGDEGAAPQEYAIGGRPRLPRAMKPVMGRPRSPIGHAPKAAPQMPLATPPMGGGALGGGAPGEDVATPPMRKGGRFGG